MAKVISLIAKKVERGLRLSRAEEMQLQIDLQIDQYPSARHKIERMSFEKLSELCSRILNQIEDDPSDPGAA